MATKEAAAAAAAAHSAASTEIVGNLFTPPPTHPHTLGPPFCKPPSQAPFF